MFFNISHLTILVLFLIFALNKLITIKAHKMNNQSLKDNSNYLTITEAAAYCKVHRKTIYNWLKSGLTSEKQPRGKRFVHYISKVELLNYVEGFQGLNKSV